MFFFLRSGAIVRDEHSAVLGQAAFCSLSLRPPGCVRQVSGKIILTSYESHLSTAVINNIDSIALASSNNCACIDEYVWQWQNASCFTCLKYGKTTTSVAVSIKRLHVLLDYNV